MRRHLTLAVLVTLAACGPARAEDRGATPSTFASVLAAAQPGDTVLLETGAYGNQSVTVQKAGRVTVRPADGATVSMSPTINGARNLTFTGFSAPSSLGATDLRGTAVRDITVSDSRFLARFYLSLCGVTAANILIDGNTFDGIGQTTGVEGRLHVAQPNCLGTSPVGVTVKGNHFGGPGESDGIQVGSNGVVIEGNEFEGFVQGSYSRHIDPIQFYGQRGTVFRGNWIHDNQVAASMMVADGARQEVIEGNVLDSTGSGDRRTLNLGSDTGSIVRHNTMVGTFMFKKASCCSNVSTGTIIRDNVVTMGISRPSGDASLPAEVTYNLLASGSMFAGMSATNLVGQPSFEGGAAPQSWDGYRLSAVSPGKANASDGTDRGAPVGAVVEPEPTPTPSPTETPTATPTSSPTPEPLPEATPTPTPEPMPTPTSSPEPGYHPACEPTCDRIITARDDRITALEANLAEALARIAAALDALE